MNAPLGHTLPKEERLSGKNSVAALVERGKWGAVQPVRYCFSRTEGSEVNRIMVSVPKKFFKRAVRRNLLKRRLRESYRLQKELLTVRGVDVMFVYSSKDILGQEALYEVMTQILKDIDSRIAR